MPPAPRRQQGRQLRQRRRVSHLPLPDRAHRRGPWRGLDDVELATREYVDWFNNRCLHGACGRDPPVEFEDYDYRSIAGLTEDAPAEPRPTESGTVHR
jgi:transposase InsO family protein